jgi:beta-mannosidase
LRRALDPVTVWTTDEGLNGIEVHAANDTRNTVVGTLRVAVYRDSGVRIAEAEETIELPPHSTLDRSTEAILGRFLDISYAYRFGVPQHNLVVTTLEQSDGIARQDFRFPLGRPRARSTAADLGLEISAATDGPSALVVTVASARLLYGARISAAGFVPGDDVFNVEPGRSVVVVLRDVEQLGSPAFVALSALNLVDTVEVRAS